jgi:hypothetical protein
VNLYKGNAEPKERPLRTRRAKVSGFKTIFCGLPEKHSQKGYANLKFAKKQLYEVYARIKGIFFPALIFISLI